MINRRWSCLGPRQRDNRRWLAAALLAMALILGSAVTAAAHADLIGADPAPGSTVTGSPSVISLSYSQPLLSTSHVELFTGQFLGVPGVTTQVAGSEMRALLSQPLTPTTSTVQWTAVSDDGHETQGSYQFAVAAANRLFGGQLAPVVAAAAIILGGSLAAAVWMLNRRRSV